MEVDEPLVIVAHLPHPVHAPAIGDEPAAVALVEPRFAALIDHTPSVKDVWNTRRTLRESK